MRTIGRDQARRFLTGHLGLRRRRREAGRPGVRAMLQELGCVQLDPLDPMGTNADLVAAARVEGIGRGDVYDHLLPGAAFEHFAKERCLLPASAFPQYRDQAVQTPWWRLSERLRRLPDGVLRAVLEEVRQRGPVTASELTQHGRVEAIDWHGWKSTSRATSMALEVLWTRCQVVVCGRTPAGKRYDVPERALPRVADAPAERFARWALLRRVEAAGLLSTASGPCWSMLREARTSELPDRLVDEGLLERVAIEGSRRTYLAPAGFLRKRFPKHDGEMRILGPLDPLLWDRKLVSHVFGFDYVWEVYKPAEARIHGWYVCPLYHRGELVGRLEGRVEDGILRVTGLWAEPDRALHLDALDACLARHAAFLGARRFVRPRRAR